MKDYLIWHYLTKRSDDIQIGDYYCFSGDGIGDIVLIQGEKHKYGYLIKLPVPEVALMRLKGLRKNFVWKAVRKSQRKKNNHYRVQGKIIFNLSNIEWRE